MKKGKIIIITILVIAILAGAGFAAVYFFTDMLKSDREMFAKYAFSEDSYEMMDFKDLEEYQKKLEGLNYTVDGTLSLESEEEELSQVLGDLKLEYTGKVKNDTKQEYAKLNVMLKNESILEAEYLRDEDTYGIICKEIINKYLAIENNNLKQLAENLGIEDTTEIPDRIESIDTEEFFKIDEKTKKEAKSKLAKFFKENTKEENFSSKKDVKFNGTTADSYTMKITAKEFSEIYTEFLKMIKNDDLFANLIIEKVKLTGTKISKDELSEAIDELIDSVKEEFEDADENSTMNITVFVNEKKTIGIETKFIDGNEEVGGVTLIPKKDSISISIKDTEDEAEIKFELKKETNYAYEGKEVTRYSFNFAADEEISIDFSYLFGLEATDSYQEQYKLDVTADDEETVSVVCDLKKAVDSNVKIEKLTDENSAKINDMDMEYMEQLFLALADKIETVAESKVQKIQELIMGTSMPTTNLTSGLTDPIASGSNMNSAMQTEEIKTFNAKFKNFEGEQNGNVVENLTNIVDSHNKIDTENQIALVVVGTDKFEKTQKFKVTTSTNSEGRIDKIEIVEIN